MGDDGKRSGQERPANDNYSPGGQGTGNETDAFERLDAVVLNIARLIGRRMARENFAEATRAANDNKPPATEGGADGE